jgi:predicted DNA-binding protein (UPF0251 family)
VPQGLDERIFKPLAVPAHALEHLEIGLDGLEALRLADLEGLYQAEAAARMGVSRATFARVLTEARRRVAEALIAGKALHVRGGAVTRRPDRRWPCPIHGGPGRRGRGCRCRRSRGDTGSDRTRRPR